MPGFVTHYLFGVDTYKRIADGDLHRNLRKNCHAYALGLQGPDMFFYYLPSYLYFRKNIGDVAHRRDTRRFFENLLKAREKYRNNKIKQRIADAYILGFMGHYCLDSIAHPYVYAFTNYNPKRPRKDTEYFGQHAYLETEIDNRLLNMKKSLSPSQFKQNTTLLLGGMQRRVIGEMVAYAYRNTYPELKVKPYQVKNATKWMKYGTRLFRDPTGQKKVIVRYVEKRLFSRPFISAMLPSDYHRFVNEPFNMEHREWKHPWNGFISQESFLDLYDKALDKYLARIMDYSKLMKEKFSLEATERFMEGHGDLSFLSGLKSE